MTGVEVDGIVKRFGPQTVLDGVSLACAPGAFTSLLGPSGSGKTTLLRIIGGFEAPEAGRVAIDGEDVTRTPLWRRRVGMVFQSYALFPHMSVADNVAYGLHRRGVRGAAARAEVRRALDLVELSGLDDRRPKQLSGGQQQRVALARAIVTKPRVLLLDEPLSALDRRLRQSMQVELRRIQRDSGLTTVFVTHDQEEALSLSDHVAILDRGRIVQEGPPADVYERPATRFAATFLGDANLFAGVVRGGTVETAQGRFHAAGPLPPDGEAVTLAVRPERLTVVPTGQPVPDGFNSIDATLRQAVYAGATSTLLLSRDGVALTCLVKGRDGPEASPGATLRLAWSPAHTVPLRT